MDKRRIAETLKRSFTAYFSGRTLASTDHDFYLARLADRLEIAEPGTAHYDRPTCPPGQDGSPCRAFYPEECACAPVTGQPANTFMIAGPAIVGKSALANSQDFVVDGDPAVKHLGLSGWGCRNLGDCLMARISATPDVYGIAGAGYLYRSAAFGVSDLSVMVVPDPRHAAAAIAGRRASKHGYQPSNQAWVRYTQDALTHGLSQNVPIYALSPQDLVGWGSSLRRLH